MVMLVEVESLVTKGEATVQLGSVGEQLGLVVSPGA